ncbi:MAG: AI-2E family transporter [Desulfobacterales bacterium]
MMNRIDQNAVFYAVLIVVGIYFAVSGVVAAKGVLMPITVAGLLAMLLLPVSGKLEAWGVNRAVAALLSTFILLILTLVFIFFMTFQIENFSDDLPEMIEIVQSKIADLEACIYAKTGISPERQEDRFVSMLRERVSMLFSNAVGLIGSVPGFLFTTLLIFVYTFFFVLSRHKFTAFLLTIVPEHNRDQAEEIILNSSKIARHYLYGRLLLILFLFVIYYAGFVVLGLKHALFISGLAAVLSLVPYIGNIIALFVALGIGLLTGFGGSGMLGVVGVFLAAQFIESYILEPYVVGSQVDINAVMTILAIVIGGALWNAVGVIIAIPVVGIVKVICDRIPALHHFGYLLGDSKSSSSWFEKLKTRIKRKRAH